MEKAMATHSSVLAWRIPGMAEPGGLPSMGSHRVGHDWSDLAAAAAAAHFALLLHYSSSGASAGGKQKCRDDRSVPTCHFTDMERHQHSEIIGRGLRRNRVRWSKQKNNSLSLCKMRSSCLKIADVMTVCCFDSLHSFLGLSLKLCEGQVGFFLLTLFSLSFFPPLHSSCYFFCPAPNNEEQVSVGQKIWPRYSPPSLPCLPLSLKPWME